MNGSFRVFASRPLDPLTTNLLGSEAVRGSWAGRSRVVSPSNVSSVRGAQEPQRTPSQRRVVSPLGSIFSARIDVSSECRKFSRAALACFVGEALTTVFGIYFCPFVVGVQGSLLNRSPWAIPQVISPHRDLELVKIFAYARFLPLQTSTHVMES